MEKPDLHALAQEYILRCTFFEPGSWSEECAKYPEMVAGWEHDRDQLVKLLELVYSHGR
jgi:hypothetical protein